MIGRKNTAMHDRESLGLDTGLNEEPATRLAPDRAAPVVSGS